MEEGNSQENSTKLQVTKIKTKANSEKNACPKCGQIFRGSKLMEHLKDHETKESHPCDSCDKIFISIWTRYRHEFKCHERELKCDECNNKYQNVETFLWHLRYIHGEKNYACLKCPYTTSLRTKLKRHIEQTHQKQYVAYCNICSKGFLDKSNLEEHKNLHSGDTPNQCELCGKSFRLKTTLRAHKFKFHAEIYPNVCKFCKKGFATPVGLESHYLVHTEIKKRFVCDFCGKQLSAAATLREHRRMHTGEYPFQCDICSKAFRAKKHLFRHVATHMENRPERKNHECYYCSKTFSTQAACLSHTRKCH